MTRSTEKSTTSRAEALRQKRKPRQATVQYSQTQLKRGVSQPARQVVSRPVTSRGVVNQRAIASVPLHQRTQSRVNRQYTIPLPTAGAELRLPTLPNIQFGWRLVSATLIFAVTAIIFAMWNAPFFQIDQAKLSGAKRLTADDINTVLKVQGIPVIQAAPRDMENELRDAFPDLASVRVSVALPAGVNVRVTERQPVIAWKQGTAALQWIDKDGYVFPARGDVPDLVLVDASAAPAAVAVAAGANPLALAAASALVKTKASSNQDTAPARFLEPDMVNAILTLGPKVPQGTTIAYSPDYGLGWNDPKGWQVFFGKNLDNMDEKLAQYQAIVTELERQNIHPKLISVEFPRAPFYRLEH